MNKALFISTVDNYINADKFLEFDFLKQDNDIDEYISDNFLVKLNSIIDIQQYVILIEIFLSSVTSNYFGLKLAYYIRLSNNEKLKYLPIIMITDFDVLTIKNKKNDLGEIFFTPNILISREEDIKERINKINFNVCEEFKNNFKKDFIDKIEIPSPTDNSTQHDISNEWSIYQWSRCLNIENNSEIKSIKKKLYIQYLTEKYKPNVSNITGVINNDSSSILYIDDNKEQGWEVILTKLIKVKFPNATLNLYNGQFSDKEKLINEVEIYIKNNKPEIVILDLRLHFNDNTDVYDNDFISNLTGVKILERIRNFNKGIQIIIFSATGKSLILDFLMQKGILGYVKKLSPNENIIPTFENINKFCNLVKFGIENKYLINVYKNIEEMNLHLSNHLSNINLVRRNELIANLNILFEILSSTNSNKMIYAMLTIFKCFEILVKSLTEVNSRKVYLLNNCIRETSHSLYNFAIFPGCHYDNYVSIRNRAHIFMKEKLNILPLTSNHYQHVTDITLKRNNYMHSNNTPIIVVSSNIHDWVITLNFIVNKIS